MIVSTYSSCRLGTAAAVSVACDDAVFAAAQFCGGSEHSGVEGSAAVCTSEEPVKACTNDVFVVILLLSE